MAEALTARDPRKLGKWKITSRLGFGGMGVVYLGNDGHQEAAVKVIRPGLLDDHRMADRFVREVSVLQAVRDVHISQFLDANLKTEPAWLAVEYISGPTVKQQVDLDGPLPAQKWWALAAGIAQALAVLEVHRVTHRDIKPSNVILSGPAGSRPVLIDFGIAHPEDATSLTATGLVTGSPSWLSPEQANMAETGAPSDIFSLGSLLAYAGTGRPPFGEGVAVAVLMRITSSEPDLDGLDEGQRELVAAMLAKDPKTRPTAREVLARARVGAQAAAGLAGDQTMPGYDPTRVSADPGESTAPDLPAVPASTGPAAAPSVAQPSPAQPSSVPPSYVPPSTASPEAPAGGAGQGSPAQPEQPAAGPRVTPEMLAPTSALPRQDQAARAVPPVVTPIVAAAPVAQPRPATPSPAPQPAPVVRKSAKLPWLVALIAVAVAGFAIWALVGAGGDTPGPEESPTATGATSKAPTSSPTATPTITGSAPPAPATNQLKAGDWLLSSYRFGNDASSMWLDGTVQNRGTAAASATLVAWIYVGGTPIGSVSTTVTDVPAGGSKSVKMTGDAKWVPGEKIVLLQEQ